MKKLVMVNKVRPGWQSIGTERRSNPAARRRALEAANQLFKGASK